MFMWIFFVNVVQCRWLDYQISDETITKPALSTTTEKSPIIFDHRGSNELIWLLRAIVLLMCIMLIYLIARLRVRIQFILFYF